MTAKGAQVEFYHRKTGGGLLEGVIVGKKAASWVAVAWRPTTSEWECQRKTEVLQRCPTNVAGVSGGL